MYWPLGAPRSYAQQLPLDLSQASADGLQDASNTAEVEEVAVENVGEKDDSSRLQEESQQSQQEHTIDNGVNGLSKEAEDISDDGRILSLRVSRYGHIFTTITSSSLTVWQTQVSTNGGRRWAAAG